SSSVAFRPLEAQMVVGPSPNDPSAHLANLMDAGQQSLKQFEDALAAAMGVPAKRSMPMGQVFSPVAFIADMHHQYLTQIWRAWNAAFVKTFTFGTHAAIEPARSDRRFKDEAWQEAPYYDLLKQFYLLVSKQLHEMVDAAQVDDRTRLQLRFFAR